MPFNKPGTHKIKYCPICGKEFGDEVYEDSTKQDNFTEYYWLFHCENCNDGAVYRLEEL